MGNAVVAEVKRNDYALQAASPELKDDKEFVLAAVTQNGFALEYASDELKDDREIVLAAVTQDGLALQHASEGMKDDKEVVTVAVTVDGNALEYANDGPRGNKVIVLAAVLQNGWTLQYASEALKCDKEIVLAAVKQKGSALQYASNDLQDDKDVVLAAVIQNGNALEYASKALKNDIDFVFAAVTQNGDALEYASDELKDDKDVVLAAVTKNGRMLYFACEELKCDKDFILAAVNRNGLALQFASEKLRDDKDIVDAAVAQNVLALEYASNRFKILAVDLNEMKDDMEKDLNACVFIPPRSIEADYKLFRALKVEGEKNTCRALFSPINSGLIEMLKTNEQKLADSVGFTITNTQLIYDKNRTFDSESALSGGFGIDVQNYVKLNVGASVTAGRSKTSHYNINMSKMKITSIDERAEVGALLEKCVGEFCNYSNGLRHVFQQTSTSYENVQYGLAFVTSVITGSINMSEASTNSGNAGATAAVPVVGDGDGDVRAYHSIGVVGIRVYFMHLVKETTGKIRIKALFPVSRSNDKYLTDALRTITANWFRRIFEGSNNSKCKVTFEIYDRADFKEKRERLVKEIFSSGMLVDHSDINNLEASLSIAESNKIGAVDTEEIHEHAIAGVLTDVFINSNNILYESTLDGLQEISKTINEKGAISIQGKLIDGIKPVIHCKMPNSLPIIYRKDLSGTTKSGEIPAWILRVKGNLIILVRVSGHQGSSGILTAHNHTDWHVREFVEYVEKGNIVRIEELKGKGFFRLDSDEAADTEMNDKVKNGAFVMMGRHILALKKEAVMAAVTQDGMALQYASDEMKADKEVVFAAVTQDGMALQYASDEMKADKEVVFAAVNNKGIALQYASKKVVLAAVKQYGILLQYALNTMKADPEVVLEAVKQNGMALKYASDDLKANKQVTMVAVKQDGMAMLYASKVNDKSLKSDDSSTTTADETVSQASADHYIVDSDDIDDVDDFDFKLHLDCDM